MFKTRSIVPIVALGAAIMLCLGFSVWSGHNDAQKWSRTMSAIRN